MECITAVFGPIPLNPTDISLAFVFVVFYAYYFVFRFRYSTATADGGGGGGPDSKEPFSGDGGLRCVGPRRAGAPTGISLIPPFQHWNLPPLQNTSPPRVYDVLGMIHRFVYYLTHIRKEAIQDDFALRLSCQLPDELAEQTTV